jgi:LacI family transcriptional regulator
MASAVIAALAGGSADAPHFTFRLVQRDSSGPAPAGA